MKKFCWTRVVENICMMLWLFFASMFVAEIALAIWANIR